MPSGALGVFIKDIPELKNDVYSTSGENHVIEVRVQNEMNTTIGTPTVQSGELLSKSETTEELLKVGEFGELSIKKSGTRTIERQTSFLTIPGSFIYTANKEASFLFDAISEVTSSKVVRASFDFHSLMETDGINPMMVSYGDTSKEMEGMVFGDSVERETQLTFSDFEAKSDPFKKHQPNRRPINGMVIQMEYRGKTIDVKLESEGILKFYFPKEIEAASALFIDEVILKHCWPSPFRSD